MPAYKNKAGINIRPIIFGLTITLLFLFIACHGDRQYHKRSLVSSGMSDSTRGSVTRDESRPVINMLLLPRNPVEGKSFRILATGGEEIRKAHIIVSGPSGSLTSIKSKPGEESTNWRIDDFTGSPAGKYKAILTVDNKVAGNLEFIISINKITPQTGAVWKTLHGWDSAMEEIYSAWINALFQGSNENSSWSALHEVTQNPNQNFLYNYLSMGEDEPEGKNRLIMQPDCADNPFFLRAYFAWKLGLPFGYHVCDRGNLIHNPKTGKWITNEISCPKTHPVDAFNTFLRRVKDGVHSGTARTAFDNENSDYYPVSLERKDLRPGIVFADPYGHTLILVSWTPQTRENTGLLLSVDAQPDGTVGIKRFWKGNFLFNTESVIGEPGFKAFRPISVHKGVPSLMKNRELAASEGLATFSLQQRNMKSDVFYHTMERLINPKPLDPETALLDLIQSLHEQLMVRVKSVANGEAYFKMHPGNVIPMPSTAAGIFQTGGQWEDFSTPNRDLRLLIAIDAVLDFPDRVVRSPKDFNISKLVAPEQIKEKLQSLLNKKGSELSISYFHNNGSVQKLTVTEILRRRDTFEMAYNPNDGIEIRWGAPENSDERSVCDRHAPSNQLKTMREIRTWFMKRLHPPT